VKGHEPKTYPPSVLDVMSCPFRYESTAVRSSPCKFPYSWHPGDLVSTFPRRTVAKGSHLRRADGSDDRPGRPSTDPQEV